jgi:hypothetical protein
VGLSQNTISPSILEPSEGGGHIYFPGLLLYPMEKCMKKNIV